MNLNSSFTPSELVDWLHDRSRFGESNDITDIDDSYATGIGYNAGVFVVIGVLLFTLCVMLYCCACCRCCCFGKKIDANGDDKDRKSLKCRKFVFFLVTLILIAAAAASAYLVSDAIDGGRDTASAIDETKDLLDRADTLTADLNSTLTEAVDVALQWRATETNPTVQAEIDSFVSAVNDAIAETDTVTDATGSTTSDLDTASDDANEYLDTAELVGWIYVAITAVWAILTFATMLCCVNKCKCVFKTLMFLALPLIFIMWVFLGALLAVSIISSDACFDPEANVVSFADAEPPFADQTSAEASVYYYMYCEANNIQETGIVTTVNDLDTEVINAEAELASIPSTNAFKVQLEGLLAEARTTLTGAEGISSLVNCDSISGIWRTVRDGLCDSTLNPLIQLWALQLVASIMLVVAIFVALRFWNHKGKAEDDHHHLPNSPAGPNPV